jgi:hypothetical protein
MTKAKIDGDTNEDRSRPSRPEDPDTQRLKRGARLLRGDMLPAVAALVVQEEDRQDDSETEASLRKATDGRERNASDD